MFVGFKLFTLFFPWLDIPVYMGLKVYFRTETDYEEFVNILIKYRETILNELEKLDEESKFLVLFKLKIDIEDYYYLEYSTREFELKRISNIQNLNQVLVQTECKNCKYHTPQLINLQEFIKMHFGN